MTSDQAAGGQDLDYDEDHDNDQCFFILGTFAAKAPAPGPQWLTAEGHCGVETAVEDSLREDEAIRGQSMKTGVCEELFTPEEARDEAIKMTLKQPPEIGRVRGWVLSGLLKLYRLVRRGAEYPHRY